MLARATAKENSLWVLGEGDQGGGELAAGYGQEAVDAGAYAGGQVLEPVGRQGGGCRP